VKACGSCHIELAYLKSSLLTNSEIFCSRSSKVAAGMDVVVADMVVEDVVVADMVVEDVVVADMVVEDVVVADMVVEDVVVVDMVIEDVDVGGAELVAFIMG